MYIAIAEMSSSNKFAKILDFVLFRRCKFFSLRFDSYLYWNVTEHGEFDWSVVLSICSSDKQSEVDFTALIQTMYSTYVAI